MFAEGVPTVEGREIRDVQGVKVVNPTESEVSWYCSRVASLSQELNEQLGDGEKYWYVGGIGRDAWVYGRPSTVISPEGRMRDVDLHVDKDYPLPYTTGPLALSFPHLRCLSVSAREKSAFLNFGNISVSVPYNYFLSYNVPFGTDRIQTFSPHVLMCLMGLGYEIMKPLRQKDLINLELLRNTFGDPEPGLLEPFEEFHRRVKEEYKFRSLLFSLGVSYTHSRIGQVIPIHHGPLKPLAKRVVRRLSS